MNAPSDPILRAIWLVCGRKDLTPTERTALLALWRFFRGKKKAIGPSLLAFLLSIHRENAKSILRRLTTKGYLASDGRQGAVFRRTATRWLTTKAKLPNLTKWGQHEPRDKVSPKTSCGDETGSPQTPLAINETGSNSNTKRGHSRPTDLGVRQGDPLVSLPPLAGDQESPVEEIEECRAEDPNPNEPVPLDHIPDGERVSVLDVIARRSNP